MAYGGPGSTQGGSTSRPAGDLVFGAVSGSGLSYTTGQTQPLTLNTAASLQVAIASGQDANTGTANDAATTSSSTSGTVISWLRGIYNALLASTPAGSAVIGKVGIDQTTPDTINGV